MILYFIDQCKMILYKGDGVTIKGLLHEWILSVVARQLQLFIH